jgi:hypothetical protein
VGVAQALQSVPPNCAGHVAHVDPVQLLRHEHTHDGTSPLTLAECPLQSVEMQIRAHVGYPP